MLVLEIMKYRIIEKSYRDSQTAEIKRYYIIQCLGFFKKWQSYKTMHCYGGDCYKDILEFNTIKKAIDYLKNLQKEVNKDKIVYETK